MPAFPHASISLGEIGREAFDTSVSSRQNFWNPPVVPELPTVTRLPVAFRNSSANASVTGKTVLDPSASMTRGDAPPGADESPRPHAARVTRRTARKVEDARKVIPLR